MGMPGVRQGSLCVKTDMLTCLQFCVTGVVRFSFDTSQLMSTRPGVIQSNNWLNILTIWNLVGYSCPGKSAGFNLTKHTC